MTSNRLIKNLVLVLALVPALTLLSCGQPPGPSASERPVIKLAISPWVASELNVTLAEIILEEEMGYPVEAVAIDEYAQWDALASGELHASLEIWTSGHGENIKRYIEGGQGVEDGGLLGPVGKIAWYIPSYVVRAHPELATWQGWQDPANAALFAGPGSGGKGRFLAGDPSWTQYDEQIIRNLGLNMEVVRLGTEEAILEALEEAYQKQQPIVMYFWTPHWAHSIYDLVPVELPPHSDECYARSNEGGVDCDYPPDLLFKVFWSGLRGYAPEAYQFLKNMNYTNLDQIAMLASVQLDGKSVEEAARDWLAENEETWKTWLP